MKQRIAVALSGMLFFVLLWSTGIVTSLTQGMQPQTALQTSATVGVELPVLMYHHVLKDEARIGDYVITPTMLENDLKEVKTRGYTPITVTQLVDYVDGKATLPEKPILITFDDGYETFYEYVFSLLQQYETPAVVSIIGKYTDLYSDNPDHHLSYSHLTWDELREMKESGLVEVGNHSYGMHANDGGRKGVLKLSSESSEQYKQVLTEDLGSLNDSIAQEVGKKPILFAYPFGAYTDETTEIVESLGFSVLLTCEEKVNVIEQGQELPLVLNRYNRAGHYSTKEIFDKIEG